MGETVAILGASDDPRRYAHRALLALRRHGHQVVPVNPNHQRIEGTPCYPDLRSCPAGIDTVTVYVRPAILRELVDDLSGARPGRVILNPGTEDREVERRLAREGIRVERGCTLVMLSAGTFAAPRPQ